MRPIDPAPVSSSASPERRPWPELLRALREVRGSTQEGWAARLGVSRKTVQRWESGERAPDPGAETAILAYCRDAGLLRSFTRGPLAGLTLSEEGLRDLFGEARWRGSGKNARPSGAAGAPVTPTIGAQPTNLPVQLTSFVGRERELAAVRRVQAGTRLLTLTGPGGCGKTRLALAMANELLWAYPHGVWFVNLAPLLDTALIAQALASTLDVRPAGQQSLTEALIDACKARQLLLLLDNCEQLLPGCAELVETLLRACPRLEVVATSRESLGIGGETVWRVPSLAFPDAAKPEADGAEGGATDAVRLFIERAGLQRPGIALPPDDLAAVAEICRELDGIPLAIELAAARINVLSVRQIAARMHDRFHLLTSGGRTALPRHQTLRAAMDWSHDLLTAPERILLRRLSVFAGGFTLEAAEAVCAGDGDEEATATAALDLLTRLVNKSLVIAEEQRGAVRYRLLETVRQYAAEKLEGAGEAAATRTRLCAWLLTLAEAAEGEMFGPREVVWLSRLEQEHDNLRVALGWLLGQREGATALRLAGALPRFWELRGRLSEGYRWLSQALAVAAESPSSGRAKALRGAGILAYMQGDFGAAQTCFQQSLALCTESSDRYGVADAQGNLGRAALRQGEYAQARALLDASLALHAELGNTLGIANAQFTLGVIALRQGDYIAANTRFQTSLALNRRLGNKEGIANALEELATVADEQGVDGQQAALLEESLALYRELGDRSGIAAVFGHLGMQAWARGEHERARALLQNGLALYREVGDQRGVARLLGNESLVAHAQRDYARAVALCQQSLTLYREAGDTWAIGRYLPVLAGAAFGLGQLKRAAHLFSVATALRERLGARLPPIVQPPHDRAIASLRAALASPAFTSAWAEGQVMSLETAMDA